MVEDNKKFVTGYVYDSHALAHINIDQRVEEHPEIPARIERIYDKLDKKGYLKQMAYIKSRLAKDEELLYAHTKEHIQFLKSTRSKEE